MSFPSNSTGTNFVIADNCSDIAIRRYVLGKGSKLYIGVGAIFKIL